MNRRKFLSLLGLGGAVVVAPVAASPVAPPVEDGGYLIGQEFWADLHAKFPEHVPEAQFVGYREINAARIEAIFNKILARGW